MNKETILNNINTQIKEINNTTKADILKRFKNNLLVNSPLDNFIVNNASSKNHFNLGVLGEFIILKYLNLSQEDKNHEIKTFLINTPNILENATTEKVYILMAFKDLNGLYFLDNASLIYKKRLSKTMIKDLLKNHQMKKIATFKDINEKIKSNL